MTEKTPTPISKGSSVRLKSGGELMDVEWLDEDEVHCVWMVKGVIHRDNFPADVLSNEDDSPWREMGL